MEKFAIHWKSIFPATPRKMPLPADAAARIADESVPIEGSEWYNWWQMIPYLQIIGALLYLALSSRPDLMFAVCLLARYSKKKTLQSCYLLCHVLSYISGTTHLGIKYTMEFMTTTIEDLMHAFSDADWAGHLKTRRSTAGFLIFMLGAPVAWSSKLMSTIAASTMESEYMAAFHCSQQIIFIRNLFRELNIILVKPTIMFMDAKAAIDGIHSDKNSARVKHMDVKWRILKQYVKEFKDKPPIIEIRHVPTATMKADILTKPVTYVIWCALVVFLVIGVGTKL